MFIETDDGKHFNDGKFFKDFFGLKKIKQPS